ncbi:hypothetical protein N7495_002625 [Penicillium taxi]|uniref:uncharacterized protein n=1 Tax=Penicillium taxi TaxID=168475 RepID=UPI0025450C52|nr:uncharacterized protein N7495_002625 [Penicillium taxi]KAJ5902097.1 hypothetical protein N7495_002625 [Penicillium taxi]
MSDSVDRVFVHALNTVKRIPRTGTARPPAAERLMLYGLYKQSMEGDVEGVMDRPIGISPEVQAECEKWDAWYSHRDLSRTEAKRRYISTLIDTMHAYASQTPEARELVGELEFVWDQIKNNATSSSSSGPLNAVGVPPLSRYQGSSYGSIGGRLDGLVDQYDRPSSRYGGQNSQLRVLSPVSQPEEEDYYRHRRRRAGHDNEDEEHVDDEDEDEDEEYEEARDSLYEDQDEDQDEDNLSTQTGTDHASHQHKHTSSKASTHSRCNSHNQHNTRSGPWRRRVEQALTKMTAEIAAMREQLEVRTLTHRRRSGILAWLKWILWASMRQFAWDLVMLGMLLILMRIRGDRRLEQRLRIGWSEFKARLGRFNSLGRVP